MRYYFTLFFYLLILSISACNSDNRQHEDNSKAGTGTIADTTLTQDRQEFFDIAARNVMLQKELARLAVEKSTTKNAKSYGQDLMTWATKKQKELIDLSKRYGIALPQNLDDEQLNHIKDITEMEASNFKYDQELWDTIKNSQQDAIEDFNDALKDVSEANATAFTLWARKSLKELQAHLEQAAAFDLELRNREGGISKPIIEEVNN
jgi:putative membrane protein